MVHTNLQYDGKGHVALLRLTQPDACASLVAACAEIGHETHARVMLITKGWADFRVEAQRSNHLANEAVEALSGLQIPTIAWIGTDCYDEALELALCADIRIASHASSFRMGQPMSGRMPSHGGTQRLPRVVGRGWAFRLLLTGETLSAPESERAGLVNAIGGLAEARRFARMIAAGAPVAMRYAKEAVRFGADLSLAQGLRLETDLNLLLHSTADRVEGLRSFRLKRPPRFEGR